MLSPTSSACRRSVGLIATTTLAQQSIKIDETVQRQISSGSEQSYAIELEAGDYVYDLLNQHGKTDLTILASDADGAPLPMDCWTSLELRTRKLLDRRFRE
jgi:hypothetical protein